MTEDLLRYERPITQDEVISLLKDETTVSTEKTGLTLDLSNLDQLIDSRIKNKKFKPEQIDASLAEMLRELLHEQPKAILLDMSFWHWLAIARFPKLVWYRWFGGITSTPSIIEEVVLSYRDKERFTGSPTQSGRSHNAIARLYFAADALYNEKDKYKLVHSVFERQDRHTAIFDREYGLLPEVASAIVRLTGGMKSREIQIMAKRLNHIGSTLVLETMTEKDLVQLLR
jgi:hypothetical protein